MAVMLQQMRLICVITLLVLIVDVSARRGGGSRGSSSRGGSRSFSRSSSSSRARASHSSIPLSGRIMRGSSPYVSSNWRAAAMAGMIYGGIRFTRMRPHQSEMPTICTNQKEKSPEGAVYGYFICPRENESDAAVYCCGPEKREYCCNRTEAEIYYSQNSRNSGGVSIGTIIGIIVAIVLVIALGAYCCKKRKHAGEIIRRFSKKGRRRGSHSAPIHHHHVTSPSGSGLEHHPRHDHHGPQAVPLNSPDSHSDGTYHPAQPPPSYTAATTAAFDGHHAYPAQPYPAQPYPAAPYPPGAPQPYPPCGMEGDKMGLPPPGVDAVTPYPLYQGDQQPKDSGAPYPTFAGSHYPSSGAPYPPTSGAPYPPTSDAPYPPTSGAPYPPESGDHYPSPGNPYPSPAAPYPTAPGAAYPPVSVAPYTSLEPVPFQDPLPTHPAGTTGSTIVPSAPMEPINATDNNNSSTYPSYQHPGNN